MAKGWVGIKTAFPDVPERLLPYCGSRIGQAFFYRRGAALLEVRLLKLRVSVPLR